MTARDHDFMVDLTMRALGMAKVKPANCHCSAYPFPHRPADYCRPDDGDSDDERECKAVRDSDRAKDAAAINRSR